MEIKQFIEKAIEGGWVSKMKENATRKIKIEFNYTHTSFIIDNGVIRIPFLVAEVLLSPKFWQAVGKVEGYPAQQCLMCGGCNKHEREDCRVIMRTGWQFKMHLMIEALAEGKSIEEYIITL